MTIVLKENKIIRLLENMPVGAMGVTLGSVSLSNAFGFLGIYSLQLVLMNLGFLVLLCGLFKMILHPKKVRQELKNPAAASIYPTFTMALMVIGEYYSKQWYSFGKSLWVIAIALNITIMILFLINHVFKNFQYQHVTPTWFIPFVGILVAVVTSSNMKEPAFVHTLFLFGFLSYCLLLPIILHRISTKEIHVNLIQTLTIMAAPPSLCVISYITIYKTPNRYLVEGLLLLVLIMTIFVYSRFPKFFSHNFHYGFAALTFPLAISCIASFKVSVYLGQIGYLAASNFLKQIGGMELFIASCVIGFVMFHYMKSFVKALKT